MIPNGEGSGGNAGVDGSVSGGAAGTGAGGKGGSSAGGAAGSSAGGAGASGGKSAGGAGGGSAGGTGGSGAGGSSAGGSGTGGSGTGGSGTGGSGTGGSGTGGSGTGGSGTGGSGTGGSGGSGGCAIKSFDFASCTGGFTHGGTNDDWSCGVPSSGPNGDHDGGGQLWATNLSGKANTCEDSYLESPTIDLSAYAGQAIRLRFWHWHAFRACASGCGFICTLANSQESGGLIQVFDGAQWQTVTPTAGYNGKKLDCYSNDPDAGPTCSPCDIDGNKGFDTGTDGSWQYAEADISSYTVSGFKVRFVFASYASDFLCFPNSAGWYIDDVSIAPVGCP